MRDPLPLPPVLTLPLPLILPALPAIPPVLPALPPVLTLLPLLLPMVGMYTLNYIPIPPVYKY